MYVYKGPINEKPSMIYLFCIRTWITLFSLWIIYMNSLTFLSPKVMLTISTSPCGRWKQGGTSKEATHVDVLPVYLGLLLSTTLEKIVGKVCSFTSKKEHEADKLVVGKKQRSWRYLESRILIQELFGTKKRLETDGFEKDTQHQISCHGDMLIRCTSLLKKWQLYYVYMCIYIHICIISYHIICVFIS